MTKQLSLFDIDEHSVLHQRLKTRNILVAEVEEREGKLPLIVSYGGGTNSTAMLLAMKLKGIVPSCIIFADTGSENPETYSFLEYFNDFLVSIKFPSLTYVRYEMKKARNRPNSLPKKPKFSDYKTLKILSLAIAVYAFESWVNLNYKYETLGEQCLVLRTLPSKAFGKSSCSVKWKLDPINDYADKNFGNGYIKCVGLHAGEAGRVAKEVMSGKQSFTNRFETYPLFEWGLFQRHCEALNTYFLEHPPSKSACWFCPNAKPSEIMELKNKHPEYYEIGVFIEENAKTDLGLSRAVKWAELYGISENAKMQAEMFASSRKCGCFDS